jgi:glycosyltransferase involved in cell wall biosynthesis
VAEAQPIPPEKMQKLKIAFITKYPPIHGGTSAQMYRLIKGLGSKGHEVHVITNAWEVEDGYHTEIYPEDLEHFQPPNVYVHSTNPFLKARFIPYSNLYTPKLANLAIEVVNRCQCDLIDSTYILPYVLAGYYCKMFTGKPQIARHASSDINNLWFHPDYKTIFTEVLKRVDGVVTPPVDRERFTAIGLANDRIFTYRKPFISYKSFSPDTKPFDFAEKIKNFDKNSFLVTYFGKIGEFKGTFRFLEAAARIKDENYTLLFVVQRGKRLKMLLRLVDKLGLREKVKIMRSVPPWRIGEIMAGSDLIVKPEYNFPLPHSPLIPYEAMIMGRPVMITTDLNKNMYAAVVDGKNGFTCDPGDPDSFAGKLKKIIHMPRDRLLEIGKNARDVFAHHKNFKDPVDENIEMYYNILTG